MAQANILIVEDEAVVAADLADKLERAGYGVVGAASRGEQAVRMAKANPPDLVLMDIRLAGPLDGVTTAECLKAFADMPVVFLTAHSDRDTLKRASLTEPFGYILKPFDERDLVTQIEIALYKHQAERRLRDSEARYRSLVETAVDSIVTIDGSGVIRSCNAATERMFGYRREDILGRHVSALIPVPKAGEDWASAYGFASGQPGVVGVWRELKGRRRDGRLFPVEIAVSEVSVGGQFLFTGIVRDVTERQAAHEALRGLAAQLEQRVQERTRELVQSQERLRGLATELNLTEQRERKRLATELHDHLAQLLVLGRMKLSQAKPLTESNPACADLIAQTAAVLDESLTYTRTLVADLSPPVLHDFGLPAALKWLGEHMQRHDLTVTVQWSGDEQLRLPEQESVLLFQSVRELLMNASKHAGCGRAVVTVDRRAGDLCIEVRDDGKGFDVAAADHGPTPMSSKFGLLSVRERMAVLGGRCDVDSAPGAGTRVTLTLPLGGSEALSGKALSIELGNEASNTGTLSAGPQRSMLSGSKLQDAKIRVLLVDDHTVVRQGLRSVLEGYPDMEVVGEAGNGFEALAMADRLRPDVIIMDVNMPQMDGVEATARITAAHPSAVVIGLSMHNSGHYEQTMKKAGAAAYLSKEAVVEHLHGTILRCRPADGASGGEGRNGVSQTLTGGAVPMAEP
ncbi:response regulator [Nitrospira moscoviensis]|uniref:Putative Histidine kinase family n=1 Tax=Nitrospira moscoviensis TaxID=42253 RepID=A0A0K2GER9_NITMO|nr:response regulator [Nitrospira moscoviensis]ALA59112.1 putative Histidine kinase family [Nitrospira moscoviensis]